MARHITRVALAALALTAGMVAGASAQTARIYPLETSAKSDWYSLDSFDLEAHDLGVDLFVFYTHAIWGRQDEPEVFRLPEERVYLDPGYQLVMHEGPHGPLPIAEVYPDGTFPLPFVSLQEQQGIAERTVWLEYDVDSAWAYMDDRRGGGGGGYPEPQPEPGLGGGGGEWSERPAPLAAEARSEVLARVKEARRVWKFRQAQKKGGVE